MGLAKKLDEQRKSFSTETTGTPGWQAPELIDLAANFSWTKKVFLYCKRFKFYRLIYFLWDVSFIMY